MSNRTYYVGINGIVRRQDGFTGPWIDVRLPVHPILYDVTTPLSDGDNVFVCGSDASIYYSQDAGLTWLTPTGDYNVDTSVLWKKVSAPSKDVIYVVGSGGRVAKSSDGGTTFNILSTLPTPSGMVGPYFCNAVYFDSETGGVVSYGDRAYSTSDGGTSWTALNGGNSFNLGKPIQDINGVFINGASIVIHGKGCVYQSPDGGISWVLAYDYTYNQGRALSKVPILGSMELYAAGLGGSVIKSSDLGATWSPVVGYTPAGLSYLMTSFYEQGNGYVGTSLGIYQTIDGGVSFTPSDVGLEFKIYSIWAVPTRLYCYELTDCLDDSITLVVSTTTLLNPLIQGALSIEGYDNCWHITGRLNCDTTQTPVIVTQTYSNCTDCLPVCYKLIDCKGIEAPIITQNDLSQYVGQVIKTKYCATCWMVLRSDTCSGAVPVLVDTSFYSCEECDPSVAPPVLEIKRRSVKPGYDTPGCTPEYVDEVNCRFAEAGYEDMLKERYGITMCCDDDLQRWWIKKDLLDLQMIYDPDACKTVCPPPPDPCPVPQPPTPGPTVCPTVSDVTVTIDIPPSCGPVSGIDVDIIFDNPPNI